MKKSILIITLLVTFTVILASAFKSNFNSKVTDRNEAIKEAISLIK